MKKLGISTLLMLTMVFLVACGDKQDSEALKSDLLEVEIRIPAEYFEGQDLEEAIAQAKAEGVEEVVQHDDGSLTYKMTKTTHDKLLTDMEDSIKDMIEHLKIDFPWLKDVSTNVSFTEFVLSVVQDEFEQNYDGFIAINFGFSGYIYQMLNGVAHDANKVTIHVKNQDTGTVFQSVVYPDDFEGN